MRKMNEVFFDITKCDACGDCIDKCEALSLYNNGFIDHELCTVCGECMEICDNGAFTLVSESG